MCHRLEASGTRPGDEAGPTQDLVRAIHPTLSIVAVPLSGHRAVLYTAGHFTVVSNEECLALERRWNSPTPSTPDAADPKHTWIEAMAANVMAAWRERLAGDLAPECLTVHPGTSCNLACGYCPVNREGPHRSARRSDLDLDVVQQAAARVAQTCAARQVPFQLVVHGGGEPMLHIDLVEEICGLTRRLASEHGLDWHGYVATNGVLDDRASRALAANFDRIGLSCDGPPDIQDANRPRRDGGRSSPMVERTSAILREAGRQIEVRATITPGTMGRQVEIVEYLVERLHASHIRFEPAYRTTAPGFLPRDAVPFAAGFLAAQARAAELSASLDYAGVRLDELHGPHCNTLKSVLQLGPDGRVTSCFLGGDPSPMSRSTLGWLETDGRLSIDDEGLRAHATRASRIPAFCERCLCRWHCARGCPEVCVADTPPECDREMRLSGAFQFRCEVNQRLAASWIARAASAVGDTAQTPAPPKDPPEDPESRRCRTLLTLVPAAIDRDAIFRQYRHLLRHCAIAGRHQPQPLWARRGFDADGASAWEQVRRQEAHDDSARAISIYLHVPFCVRRCGFCDCLARPLSAGANGLVDEYAQRVCQEIDLWASIDGIRGRPVTTVHFGGGTPNCLPRPMLAAIVRRIRDTFAVHDRTEWALESTSSLLTDDHLARLRELGFDRLHVGVQTFTDEVRRRVGRRDTATIVAQKLSSALAHGFVTSIDLVYGLPGETMTGWTESVSRAVALGLHGVSLYRLNVSARNRTFLERCGAERPGDIDTFVCLQVAEQLLTGQGFSKIFFNHFARGDDRYLYYGFVGRHEDLVAIGPSADGVVGDVLFRHHDLNGYMREAAPGFEGGVTRSAVDRQAAWWESALLAGRLPRQVAESCRDVVDRWEEAALVTAGTSDGALVLTANGSWVLGQMLTDIGAALAERAAPDARGTDRT
jgi:coproporphyrinogen III oxidase-like Fe-S oxidoreductase/sulfatase maturation enzyme AslB (radical SAM superfamily)